MSQQHESITPPENAIKPSLPIKNYTGLYHSNIYGDAQITVKKEEMKVQLLHSSIWNGTITPLNADTFRIEFGKVLSLPQGRIYFKLDESNKKIQSFIIDIPNPDFDFTEFEFIKQ